jgi:probable addiction module antidote protein
MPKRTREYHEFLLEQLTEPVFAAEYLNEARLDSQKMFLKALRNVAESRRMSVLAEQTGLNRESLYKSLSEDGNPRLETYDSVLSALGIDYEFKPKGARDLTPEPTEPVRIQQEASSVILIAPTQEPSTWAAAINAFASSSIGVESKGEQMPDLQILHMIGSQTPLRQEARQG